MANILWHASPLDLVLRQLNTDPRTGLTLEETRRRLEEHGYNELKKEAKTSPVVLFLNQFKNTLIIILAVATVLSAVIGDLLDAGIILAIIVFCALLGFIQEYRAERALDALRKMLTPTITALRGGREDKIPSKELVPGDIILLEAGDKIPADGRLVEVYSLQCDEAPLTGESFPVEKDLKVLPEEVPVGDRKNMIFTGTAVSYGRGKAVITNTGADTEFGKIATELATVSQEKTPLEKRTEEIGKWLGIIAVAVCVLVVVTSVIREAVGGRLDLQFTLTMLLFAIALAVAAVPEALAAIVTGALAIGMHEMAKRNALVRKMPAVETLGCATVICSDKTGTLTKGEMTVRRVFGGGEYVDVSGVGYAPEGSLNPVSKNSSLAMLFKGAILCNDSALMQTEGKWSVKGDPTEGALLALGGKAGLQIEETKKQFPRIGEFPFSSDRKRMTTVHKDSGGKRVAFMKGAPEILLGRCSMFFDGDAPKPLSDGERQRILSANEKMASDALRVLGIACRDLNENDEQSEELVENGLVFLGLIGMMDPPREEAIEAVRVCQQVAIKPVMITGDHKVTAVAVAKELGIYREGDLVFTGEELSKTDDDELGRVVNKITVYARVSPLDKLKIVKAWKERGEVVAMTGDGVNDAPALKHADIGIAMGITGTEVAKEAADIVLSDDNFATIVRAIERGRWIYDNIKKYLTYLLRANITEVVVLGGVVMVMGPQYLPLLPAAILYINLATDGLPALALGVAPADPDIMQRPPRDPRESVFSKDIRMLILMAVIIECPIFLWMFFRSQPDMELARTLVFFMFVFIELIIAINFRSLRYSLIQAPPHKWLLIAIAWELGLIALLIQFPAVRDAFGITIPSIADMGLICAIGIGIVIVIEIAKATFRTTIAQTPMSVRSNSV